ERRNALRRDPRRVLRGRGVILGGGLIIWGGALVALCRSLLGRRFLRRSFLDRRLLRGSLFDRGFDGNLGRRLRGDGGLGRGRSLLRVGGGSCQQRSARDQCGGEQRGESSAHPL